MCKVKFTCVEIQLKLVLSNFCAVVRILIQNVD